MKRILVCVDGSEQESGVVAASVELAERFGARLTLFRAVTVPAELPAMALSATPDEVQRALVDGAQAALERLRGKLAPGLVAETRVDISTPWRGITAAATELDVDLIVVGSHGYGGIDRLLGTNAAKVVNHADRSVLVVRAAARL